MLAVYIMIGYLAYMLHVPNWFWWIFVGSAIYKILNTVEVKRRADNGK